MARTAAFFDLDRTLLAGSSGPAFAEAFSRLGVATPKVPGQELLFKYFDLVGESYLVMQLAKRAVSRARGIQRADVAVVAESAADVLHPKVQPYAPALLRNHRDEGDLLVLATTSPYDLVAPLARRLGFDAVVATRYAEMEGVYTGELDGGFVWGPGKLAAVKAWAEENDVDLSASAAYSDSVFDSPLLGAVGRPHAVNPDYRLRALAAVRGWPVKTLDTPDGVPSVSGVEPFDVVRFLTRPELFPGVRFTFEGIENIPRSGPAIIASNHRSYFDPLAIALAIGKAGRNGRFLGKKEVFDVPIFGQIATAMGGIRVERGTGSDAPLKAAAERLAAGEVVVILPEGTIPRGEAFFDPILRGKTGVARLAAMAPDVPVIPMGVWGTEKVWPRSAKVPNLLQVTDPPRITISIGEPLVGLARKPMSEKAIRSDTDRIMEAIMDVLPPESREARAVSAEELAKTTPDGKIPSKSKAKPAAGTAAATAEAAVRTEDEAPAKKAKKDSAAKSAPKPGKTVAVKGKKPTKAKAATPSASAEPATKAPKKKAQPTATAKATNASRATPGPAAATAKRVPPSRRVEGTLAKR